MARWWLVAIDWPTSGTMLLAALISTAALGTGTSGISRTGEPRRSTQLTFTARLTSISRGSPWRVSKSRCFVSLVILPVRTVSADGEETTL